MADFPENATCVSVAWSPDGKRVTYTRMQLHLELLKKDGITVDENATPTESFLIVADIDGKNAKTIASGKANDAANPSLVRFQEICSARVGVRVARRESV